MINSWNLLSSNEKITTVFNMMIVKKFSKDVQDLSTNKIFKRNLSFFHINNKCDNIEFINVLVEKADIEKKDAQQIVKHPGIIAEAKDGSIVVSNLTSSEYVKGKETVEVGVNFKTGGKSYLAKQEIVVIKPENKSELITIISSPDVINKFKGIKKIELNKLANNVGNEIEAATGKELKNKNYESIDLLKKTPIDKI